MTWVLDNLDLIWSRIHRHLVTVPASLVSDVRTSLDTAVEPAVEPAAAPDRGTAARGTAREAAREAAPVARVDPGAPVLEETG